MCPSNPRNSPTAWGPYYGYTHPCFITYSFNHMLSGVPQAQLTLPAETCALGDSQHSGLTLYDKRTAWPKICADYGPGGGCPNKGPISDAVQYAAHNDGDLRAFCDGHVKWYPFMTIYGGQLRYAP